MGLNADAELVWGIPVLAYDEDDRYKATPFWDVERNDWREFEGDLYVRRWGHYEDPDNRRGILTSKRVQLYAADCWTPTPVDKIDLSDEMSNDRLYSKSNDQARAAGLDVNFYQDAAWWLVASFG